MAHKIKTVGLIALLATALLAGCGEREDPYAEGKTQSSADVSPTRMEAYRRLERCEFEVAEIRGMPRPDSDDDRRRRAHEANADIGTEDDCEEYLRRLQAQGD